MTPSRSNLVALNLVRAKQKRLKQSDYKFLSRFQTVQTPSGLKLVYTTELFGSIMLTPVEKLDTHTFNKLHMIAHDGRKH